MTIDSAEILNTVAALPGRSTRVIVDLDVIARNVSTLRAGLSSGQDLCAVVKADGYGHGAIMVGRTALDSGATMLAVATVGEAADLRRHGVVAPILLLSPIDPTEVRRALELDLEFTVGDLALLTVIGRTAAGLGVTASIHLKIDTGMNRYGCFPGEALAFAETISVADGIRLAGIASHFATADEPETASGAEQAEQFHQIANGIRDRLAPDAKLHISNSAASIRNLSPNSTMVRVGIALYGLQPGPDIELPSGIRPALSLISRLARVHLAESGGGVSYGQTYRISSPERLGLIPLGYADGYPRLLSNRSWVGIDGASCPVRGRICMDQIVVGDLLLSTTVGTIIGLAGPIGGGPSLTELADLAETINYEIAVGINPRVPRYYVRDGVVVATLIEGRLDIL